MFKNLPPLNALRAFEAAARLSSFTLAADELSVTQGAISYQIKNLESQLGVSLFERKIRKVRLTESGKQLFRASHRMLEDLDNQLSRIVPKKESPIVTVSVSTFFVTRWLSQRLGQFVNQNPAITLQLQHSVNDPDFSISNVDLAVRWGNGQWSDCCVEPLLESPMLALCSPKLLDGKQPLRTLRDLRNQSFLHDQANIDCWNEWLSLAGQPELENGPGPLILDPNVRIQSAVDGHGLVLANNLVTVEIEQGLLVEPFDIRLNGKGFFLTYQDEAMQRTENKIFRDWIIGESKSS